jgi:hypothetical protein
MHGHVSSPSPKCSLPTSMGKLEFLVVLPFFNPIGVGCGSLHGKPQMPTPQDLEVNDKEQVVPSPMTCPQIP